MVTVRLVGRGAELMALERIVEEVRGGAARRVVLEGPVGIGKTRLVDEVINIAAAARFTCLRGAGAELHQRPFALLVDAFVGGKAPVDPVRQAIVEILADVPEGVAPVVDHRYRVIEAMEEALEHEAMSRPVLIAAEDAHWADPGSILGLDQLARRRDLPQLQIITCRSVPRGAELARLLRGVREAGDLHIDLERLTEAEVAELAVERLGSTPGPNLRRHLDRTGGNPLFALELIEGLVADNALEVCDGVTDAVAPFESPRSLRSMILRRLSLLDDRSRELFRFASVLGSRFSVEDLSLASGSSLVDVVSILDQPFRAGFIVADGTEFAFHHDVVREAVYEDIPPPARKALHLHVGRTLAARGRTATEVAPHMALGASPGDREAAQWLGDAARAIARNAPGVAADLLCQAGALLPPEDPGRLPLMMPAVRQLALVGRTAEAAALAESLAAVAAGSPMQVLLDLERFSLLIAELRFDEVRSYLSRLLDEDHPEFFRMQFLATYAAVDIALGDVRRAAETINEVRDFADRFPSTPTAALTRLIDGYHHILRGEFALAVGDFERAVPGTELFVGGREQGLLLLATAQSLGADQYEQSVATMETARAGLERRGALAYVVEYHWFLAHLHFVVGRWDDAVAEMEACRELSAKIDTSGMGLLVVGDFTPLAYLFRGQVSEAEAAMRVVDREATEGVSAAVAAWREPMRATLQHVVGSSADAKNTVSTWLAQLAEADFAPDLRTIGRSLLAVCRDDAQLLSRLHAAATAAHERSAGVASAEGAALLVLGAIDDDPDRLVAAAAACRAGGRPLDIAESAAEAALSFLRRGDRDRGLALADDALAFYDQLGVRWQRAALAQQLRELGVRRSSRQRHATDRVGWPSLTESERRVVKLVSEGLTNREIGQRLFISSGTVATHLRNVFRKIGVSSRAQLATEAVRHMDPPISTNR